jgi:hypothetical protein
MSICYTCGGSGRSAVTNSSLLIQDGGPCPSCGGSGKGYTSPSPSGGGSGGRKRESTPEQDENSFRWMMGFLAGGIILYNTNESLQAAASADPDSNAYWISVAIILISCGLVARFVPMVARIIAWGVAIAIIAFIYNAVKNN